MPTWQPRASEHVRRARHPESPSESHGAPGVGSRRKHHFAGLLVAVAFLGVPVQAEATDLLAAPTNLSGEYDADNHAINLTWLPPANNTTQESVYHVYQDGLPLANTTWTNLTTDLPLGGHVYWVTATNDQGQESLPSPPLVAAVLAVGIPCRVLKEGDERVADMAFRNTERTASPPWRPGSS